MSAGSTNRFELAAKLVGYRNSKRYRFRGEFLFQGIPVAHARLLEIGCGAGAWAIWAALNRAQKVLGIEPEVEGSSAHSLERFRRNIETLGLTEQVTAQRCTLQELPASQNGFDIAIMYNVINHLDEDAVTRLHQDATAVERYVILLSKLHTHLAPDGWVVVADCGRDNFWTRFGLPSPFMPDIEWHKHQNPQTWIDVFTRAGFGLVDLRWSPLNPFPRLTGNQFVEYLTCSHFVLRFKASKPEAS